MKAISFCSNTNGCRASYMAFSRPYVETANINYNTSFMSFGVKLGKKKTNYIITDAGVKPMLKCLPSNMKSALTTELLIIWIFWIFFVGSDSYNEVYILLTSRLLCSLVVVLPLGHATVNTWHLSLCRLLCNPHSFAANVNKPLSMLPPRVYPGHWFR